MLTNSLDLLMRSLWFQKSCALPNSLVQGRGYSAAANEELVVRIDHMGESITEGEIASVLVKAGKRSAFQTGPFLPEISWILLADFNRHVFRYSILIQMPVR
jgi:hypothetical protein